MKRLCGLVLGLLVLATGPLPAEPPKQGRVLTAEEQKEVDRLVGETSRHLVAGRFEDGVAMLKQVVDYWAARQGTNHWQVIDVRLNVERWQRLTAVPAKDRAEVGRALTAEAVGIQLQRRLRYREAEAKLRLALASTRKVLGEQHPDTARSYSNVAVCLDSQGKYAAALPLHQKALAIKQKALGEQHPETATSYNNVASCLQSQGRHAEALPLFHKALAIRLAALGEQHPDTATGYNNVASCLQSQGKHAEALPLLQKGLALRRKILGEQHPDTANGYNNVASCLDDQGKYAEALPLYRKALAIKRKVLGEQHPDTAQSYNNLAFCLDRQGQHAEALPLYQQALAIFQKVLGEQHPDTATGYNNMAFCLSEQGKHAEALPLYEKALVIRLRGLTEQHPLTADSYNNLASCLDSQGRHAEALLLHQKALALHRKLLGDRHPDTARGYNNLAACLDSQGKHAEALPLYQKALAIRLKVLGEQHPDTATSYNNVAGCLQSQGKLADALPLYAKALAIFRKRLGEQHPNTTLGYNNVAICLYRQGKPAEALPLFHKALALRLKVLGAQHPDTAETCTGVAFCLQSQGKHAEAVRYWEQALLGSEWGRLQAGASGFDRSLYKANAFSPRSALAICLVRLGKPLEAWRHAEADLARGLLDDLLPSAENTVDADRRRLHQLSKALLPLLARETLDAEQVERRDALVKERDALLTAVATHAARRIRARVLSLSRIQKQLPADAAIVFWLDFRNEHLGCVLRRQGPPRWLSLPGSGDRNAWTREDDSLPTLVYLSLLAESLQDEEKQALLKQSTEQDRPLFRRALDPSQGQRFRSALHQQRLAVLEPHLKGVRQLLVVPAGQMSAVPVEALTEHYTVSYVSSASVFARLMEKHRALEASSLLVLADPAFRRTAPVLPAAPPHGLLVLSVTPGGLAARVGLHPGDVLLEYGGKKLSNPADLEPPEGNDRVPLRLWREGKTLAGRIAAGKLGVVVDKRPVAEALAAWRKQAGDLRTLGRGGDWQPLPGTRLEALALAKLVPQTTTLLGSDASQQRLAELAAADKLKAYRLLHLATHGQANTVQPERTALILAQDHVDDAAAAARAVLAGQKPVEGWLTVATVLADWHLDADLVVLSACQTGLGKDSGGEGMLGFTQALLQKGARSVLLSRWKVDDAATALLMVRFYENLLGSRKGTKPLGRAAALAEAKAWLRQLSRAEATQRLAALVDGVPRGERGSIKAALPARKPDTPKGADRPFAAPYFWAAFVLLGDPY